jgi:hypothetical protein
MSAGSGIGPSIVMVIRHGEKPGDPSDDTSGGPDLSVQGMARAAALPSLSLPATASLECAVKLTSATGFSGTYSSTTVPGTSPRFPTPEFLFATADSQASHRPKQTITPTAAALGLTINHEYTNNPKHIGELGQLLLTSAYAGKVILICWHHGTMQDLAKALKATGATPWVGTVFDRVWLIDYQKSSAIQQYGQQLLLGDETNVPGTPW